MFHDHACPVSLAFWVLGASSASVANPSILSSLPVSRIIFICSFPLCLSSLSPQSSCFCDSPSSSVSLSVYSVHIFSVLICWFFLSPSEPSAFSISHHHPFSQSLSLVVVNWPSHRQQQGLQESCLWRRVQGFPES